MPHQHVSHSCQSVLDRRSVLLLLLCGQRCLASRPWEPAFVEPHHVNQSSYISCVQDSSQESTGNNWGAL